MTPDSPQMFGVALMVLWGTAGAVALGRAAAKSPATRELLAAARKMNLAAKGAIVAGLHSASRSRIFTARSKDCIIISRNVGFFVIFH